MTLHASRRIARVAVVFACVSVAAVATASADTLTLGLFAPTAPFPSTTARVDLASRLAEQLGKAINATGTGKVFARAGDYSAGVKSNEVEVGLVDASFLAVAGGNYTLLAAAVSGGDTSHGWQLVAKGVNNVAALRGKRVLVPGIGGRETDFVLNALLGGEIARDFFARIETAPDTASALAALGLGKADAAVVPAGAELPAGTSVVLKLGSIAGQVLVAYGATATQRNALTEAALAFQGDAVISGFRAADAGAVRAIAGRMTAPDKRGPFAVPGIRLLVTDLLDGRTFTIERTPVTSFVAAPDMR
jgi:hypothetical protein